MGVRIVIITVSTLYSQIQLCILFWIECALSMRKVFQLSAQITICKRVTAWCTGVHYSQDKCPILRLHMLNVLCERAGLVFMRSQKMLLHNCMS